MRLSSLLSAAVNCLLLCGSMAYASLGSSDSDGYRWVWKSSLTVPAAQNTQLKADAFVPVPKTTGEKFPVVIFPNSWGCPQIEYLPRALNLAHHGYIGFEYETRGWYTSGGVIDVAGPMDRLDGSTMIDFIQAHAEEWNADMSKIAFMGISYGAGISLEMAGYDERVTTAVAMSGWNNITLMMYGNESPNRMLLDELLSTAEGNGVVNASLKAVLGDLLQHKNMDAFKNFVDQRSPQAWLDSLNRRNVPLFLSSNYLDHLFRPQYMHQFFEKLTTPKFMLMNQGPHAFPEAAGIFIHDNYIWSHAYQWLDQWLKGVDTGILQEPNLQLQQGDSIASNVYVPVTTNATTLSKFVLTPRGTNAAGGMAPGAQPTGAELPLLFSEDVQLQEANDTASIALGRPFYQNLTQPPESSIVYLSDVMPAGVQLCGTPSVDLHVNATEDNWQFYTYLYIVRDPGSSVGELWSHGFFTNYADGPTSGVTAQRLGDGTYRVVGADLHSLCKVVPEGSQLALGVTLYDRYFQPASTTARLSVVYNDAASSLNLPLIH